MIKGWPRVNLGPLHTIIIHTKTDQTIRGLRIDKTKEFIVLRPASIAGTDQNGAIVWTRLDGDIVVPLENIDFMQEGVEAQLAGLLPELFEE